MCSYCKKYLVDPTLSPSHTDLTCPLKQAEYCAVCATTGHTTQMCGQALTLSYREPMYFEQILHPGELDQYNLTESRTPLPSAFKPAELPKDPRMVVPEYKDPRATDKVIQNILRAHKIAPGNMKKNKELIAKLASTKGLRLVYQTV